MSEPTLAPGEVHVWRARLEVSLEALAVLHASLPADERERGERFRFPHNQQRFVAAHGALRDVLGRYLRAPPGEIRYAYNAFGKPELSQEFDGRLRFNLTHSGGWALIAVASGFDVGVDLESIRMRPDYGEIARRLLSETEVEQLNGCPRREYAEAFLSCWTKREAYLKACGWGLAKPLNQLAIPVRTNPEEGPIELRMTSGGEPQATSWSIYTLRPAPGLIGALAIEGSGWRLCQRRWSMPRVAAPATGG